MTISITAGTLLALIVAGIAMVALVRFCLLPGYAVFVLYRIGWANPREAAGLIAVASLFGFALLTCSGVVLYWGLR